MPGDTDPSLPRVTSTSADKLATVHDVHAAQFSVTGAIVDVARSLTSTRALVLLVLVAVVAGLVLRVATAYGQDVKERVDAGQAAQDALIAAEATARRDLADRYAQHVIDSGKAHESLRADLREVQLDLREAYRSQRTGERSRRLESPPTIAADGGAP